MAEDIKVGSRVVVPFGAQELEGTVIRVSRVGAVVRVTVSLDIEGVDGPNTTSFRVEEIRAVSAA